MGKTQDEFLDHFARLGVFSKVQALIEPDNENEIAKTANETITAVSVNPSDDQSATGISLTNSALSAQQQSQTSGIYDVKILYTYICIY